MFVPGNVPYTGTVIYVLVSVYINQTVDLLQHALIQAMSTWCKKTELLLKCAMNCGRKLTTK